MGQSSILINRLLLATILIAIVITLTVLFLYISQPIPILRVSFQLGGWTELNYFELYDDGKLFAYVGERSNQYFEFTFSRQNINDVKFPMNSRSLFRDNPIYGQKQLSEMEVDEILLLARNVVSTGDLSESYFRMLDTGACIVEYQAKRYRSDTDESPYYELTKKLTSISPVKINQYNTKYSSSI